MAVDTDKVSADIHTTIEGGLYRNAGGAYVKADGSVLDEKKDEDKEHIEDGKAIAEASAKKRAEATAAAPVPGAPVPVTQAEMDAKIQLAVAAALANAGVGADSGKSRGKANQ